MANKRGLPEVIVEVVTLPEDDPALFPTKYNWYPYCDGPEATALTPDELVDAVRMVDPDVLSAFQAKLYTYLWSVPDGVLYKRTHANIDQNLPKQE